MKKISLLRSTAQPPPGVYAVNIPPSIIGVLSQMRTKMSAEGLDDLKESILQVGQLNPGIVVGLTQSGALEYLGRINEMWGTQYELTQFVPLWLEERGEIYYFFAAAGHRRLTAVQMANLDTFFCYLHLHISFSHALFLQYQENLHESVAPDNEARFLTLFWREEKKKKPDLTLAAFAKKLGKTPDAVRRALRFTALPTSIQKLIDPDAKLTKKGAGYAVLCELARLEEAYAEKGQSHSEIELMQLAYYLVAEHRTAVACAHWVSKQIDELNGQGNMFELELEVAVAKARKSVATGMEQAVRLSTAHLRAVARFHEEGGVPKIASGSTINAVTLGAELTDEIAPKVVENIRGGRGAPRARAALKRVP